MKKKLVTLMLAGIMTFSMMACGGSGNADKNDSSQNSNQESGAETDATDSTDIEVSNSEENAGDVTYQSILDEYSKQIIDATPGLVDEYNAEAEEAGADIEKLAEISNDKISKLAEINSKGTQEMASLMMTTGDEYETYEEWAGKLYDVYEEYAGQITDAYMDSASGMSTDELLESLENMQ